MWLPNSLYAVVLCYFVIILANRCWQTNLGDPPSAFSLSKLVFSCLTFKTSATLFKIVCTGGDINPICILFLLRTWPALQLCSVECLSCVMVSSCSNFDLLLHVNSKFFGVNCVTCNNHCSFKYHNGMLPCFIVDILRWSGYSLWPLLCFLKSYSSVEKIILG